MARLRQPGLATLRQERLAVDVPESPGEKKHPLAEGGILPAEALVEVVPIELGHPQVTEDEIIALRLEVRARCPLAAVSTA